MSKYTKSERNEIYTGALAILRPYDKHTGLCNAVARVTGYMPNTIMLKEDFPELYSFRPHIKTDLRVFFGISTNTHPNSYWFPLTDSGYSKRIGILEECIKMTQP